MPTRVPHPYLTFITGEPLALAGQAQIRNDLDVYSRAEVYNKNEVYTKTESDARFASIGGVWTAGTIAQPGEIWRDGGWTSAALVATEDRPAPYYTGDRSNAVSVAPTFATTSFAGLVRSGQIYTFTESGIIKEMLAWVPAVDPDIEYQFIFADLTDPANVAYRYVTAPPTITPNAWFTVSVGDYIVGEGSVVGVFIQALNSSGEGADTGNWNYDGTSQNGAPSSMGWNRNTFQSTLRISHTDVGGGSRESDLLAAIPGSTIRISEVGDPSAYYEYFVTLTNNETGYVEYEVDLIGSGSGGPSVSAETIVDFTIPGVQFTEYVQESNYWSTNGNPSFATVQGYLTWEGGDVSAPNDLFGVDIEFQPAAISDDWTVLSYSSEIDFTSDEDTLDVLSEVDNGLGWAVYADSTHTSGSPLNVNDARVKVTIDGLGATTDASQMPPGGSFWNPVSNKIEPMKVGDIYHVRMSCECDNGGQSNFNVQLDIGGVPGVIIEETKELVKGAGLTTRMVLDWTLYIGSTFLANGAEIYLDTTESDDNINFWDFTLLIQRAYVGRD